MDDSPVFQDIRLYSTATFSENNEDLFGDIDSMFHMNSMQYTNSYQPVPGDFEPLIYPFDMISVNYPEEEEIGSIGQFLSDSCFEIPQSISTSYQQNIIPSVSSLIDIKYETNMSLSFINPPEPTYHVRYLSEITESPLNGNVVNTRIKTEKNISGRYLKGIRSRYVTIALPSNLSDHSNLFIRVTRLTVPYQDVSFIHPYPLLYSRSDVICQDSSLYFKIKKEDICSGSKRFPNISLTRLKQCELKKLNNLHSFDNGDNCHPFISNNVKQIIALYQLKKSKLDFRLAVQIKPGTFLSTDICCRSNELVEKEGVQLRRSSNN